MISIGSRAALATSLITILLVGCEQDGRDDSSDLGDGPSTIDGDGDGDTTSDTDESGTGSETSVDESDTTDGSSGDATDDTTDTTDTGFDPCDGMTATVVADFYNDSDVHLAEQVFAECLTLGTFGDSEGFVLTTSFGEDAELFISLPATTTTGESQVAAGGEVFVNFEVDSTVPPAWRGLYLLVSGDLYVPEWGLQQGDTVTLTFTGTLEGPGNFEHYVNVIIMVSVEILYE
jgi:hypothetical protein